MKKREKKTPTKHEAHHALSSSHHSHYPGAWMPMCRSPRKTRHKMLDESE